MEAEERSKVQFAGSWSSFKIELQERRHGTYSSRSLLHTSAITEASMPTTVPRSSTLKGAKSPSVAACIAPWLIKPKLKWRSEAVESAARGRLTRAEEATAAIPTAVRPVDAQLVGTSTEARNAFASGPADGPPTTLIILLWRAPTWPTST